MTVNQQTVEETKQQIRLLVNEIAALSKSGSPAEEFYPGLLQRIITALAAVGGVCDAVQAFREDWVQQGRQHVGRAHVLGGGELHRLDELLDPDLL